MTRYHRGDKVTTTRRVEDMNVPVVPKGAEGTVVATSLFGRPTRVAFELSDGWGLKHFDARVEPGDVRRARGGDA